MGHEGGDEEAGGQGTGALPIITGTGNSVVQLTNQQYWEINNLEIVGGVYYGVYIIGNADNVPLYHVYLTNLNVHGATYVSTKRLDSGEIVYESSGANGTWNDIVINGVTSHDTTAGEGIYIQAGGLYVYPETNQTLGSNITIKNSTVQNVAGDGILVIQASNVMIENNVTNASGQCRQCSGTPSGTWVWQCTNMPPTILCSARKPRCSCRTICTIQSPARARRGSGMERHTLRSPRFKRRLARTQAACMRIPC